MSDLGFVNRRDVKGPPPRREAPRPGNGPRPDGSNSTPRGGGGAGRGGGRPPQQPAPAAPPLKQPPPRPVQTPTPVSVLKRQQSNPPPPTASLYPNQDDDDDDDEEDRPSSVSFASKPPVNDALVREVGALKNVVAELSKKLAADSKAHKDGLLQFFGHVSGGSSERVLLFESIPKEFSVEKASAKADKNTWVKLSYPQTRVERTLANGSTQVDLWLRAYAIDPVTSDISLFWVREKAEDETAAFKRFAWYPVN